MLTVLCIFACKNVHLNHSDVLKGCRPQLSCNFFWLYNVGPTVWCVDAIPKIIQSANPNQLPSPVLQAIIPMCYLICQWTWKSVKLLKSKTKNLELEGGSTSSQQASLFFSPTSPTIKKMNRTCDTIYKGRWFDHPRRLINYTDHILPQSIHHVTKMLNQWMLWRLNYTCSPSILTFQSF